ncbi:MAG: nicotinate-nucleotide adenylyltransferase [Planctomycetaceae bacterium]
MRLGLFGGTFDPVHLGHLVLAECCREQCVLDQIWFLPAGDPPHKPGKSISPGKTRAEMLEFAIAGHPQFAVNRMELEREGKSFTFETLGRLQKEEPGRELFFLIGADSLADLPTWREPRRILELATIVAVNRGDRPLPDIDSIAQRIAGKSDVAAVRDRLRVVTMPGVDISSTEIRARVRTGQSIRFLVPRAVEMYIAEHKLYVD